MVFLAGCGTLGQRYGEEALYATIFSDGDYEIRLYEPLIIAQAASEGSYRKATRIGYQRLTNYVTGNNLANTAITSRALPSASQNKQALTTPYYEEYLDGTWLTSVALPERYTLDTLPKPADEFITFQTLPRIKTAVISFSGLKSERLINNKANLLLQWLKQENLVPISPARSAIFDAPGALPGLRRHEVHISIQ